MRVALAHHWLVTQRGGEKVLEQLCRLFPRAPIHTLVAAPILPSPVFACHKIHQTFLGQIPLGHRIYQQTLPLHPLALRWAPKIDADFLLCSDASLIKGIARTRQTRLVCYCYSPPRYIWDLSQEYARDLPQAQAFALRLFKRSLRNFDFSAAQRVDGFIAISRFVAQRIKYAYGQESIVVHPPVDVQAFAPCLRSKDHYLVVSALTPYKRIDLAVQAFNQLGLPLLVIGHGPLHTRLKAMAASNITFLGTQPHSVLREAYQSCRALIFPGIEDFGITPLEAQASGRPVVAYGHGGVLETVLPEKTGIYFPEQNVDSLMAAVLRMEAEFGNFDPRECRENARKFQANNFRQNLRAALNRIEPELFNGYQWPDATET